MQCPHCKIELKQAVSLCPQCHAAFSAEFAGALAAYRSMQRDLGELKVAQKFIGDALIRVEASLEQFQKAVINTPVPDSTAEPEKPLIPAEAVAEKPAPDTLQTPEIKEQAKPEVSDLRDVSTSKKPEQIIEPEKRREITVDFEQFNFDFFFGQKGLLIIGIIISVIGVGYFLKYSFTKGWVPPEGRVALSYLWGLAFLGGGEYFRKKIPLFGLSLIGGALAIFYFSTFAAFQLYHLFPQALAFVVMVLITASAAFLAVVHDTKWLAVLGLIGGFATPLMLSTGSANQPVLMSYMALLNVGILSVAFKKRWDLLNILGFIATYALFTGWYEAHYHAETFPLTVLFLHLFFGIYTAVPFLTSLSRGDCRKRELVILSLNSYIAFAYMSAMIEHNGYDTAWLGLVSVAYAAVFVGCILYLKKEGKLQGRALPVYLGNASLFLIIAVPVMFSGHWITLFWAAEACVLLYIARSLTSSFFSKAAHLLLVSALGKFFFYDLPEVFNFYYDYYYFENYFENIAPRLILEAALPGAVYYFLSKTEEKHWYYGTLGVLLFVLISCEVSGLSYALAPSARNAAVSITWALFASALLILGLKHNQPLVRKFSVGLFIVTIIKVIASDMAEFSTPYRIISFVGLGMIMIACSYAYHKFLSKQEETPRKEQ